MERVDTILGNNLRDLRIYGNLCISHISKCIGVSYQHYRRLERGLREITAEQLEKISEIYNIEPYDLLTVPNIVEKNDIPIMKYSRKISERDLDEIAKFNKIVRNYIKMDRIAKRAEEKEKK